MIKHQAFLDLEEALASRLSNAWVQYWGKLSADLVQLTAQGRFDEAHKLADTLDLGPLFERATPMARTLGMSALLLGASRITPRIRDSRIAKERSTKRLDSFLRQTQVLLGQNTSEALRQHVHAWLTEEEQRLVKADTETLYVHRKLINAVAFIAWAKSQGFETTLPEDEVHVTIAYSKAKVNWAKLQPEAETLTVVGGARIVKPLGDKGAVVLRFYSSDLADRWWALRGAGCSWDYEGYQPHVTITYQAPKDLDLSKVQPYDGPLEFGPEVFEALDEDWAEDVVEKAEAATSDKVGTLGKNYLAMAASVQISRLSAYGFLEEAYAKGVKNYRIDAVLDSRTCEVCRIMDGTVFPVEQGLAMANVLMDLDDPQAAKHIAPFYAQNKASLAALESYGTEDFVEAGMILPPYHPLCRCIVVKTEKEPELHPTDSFDRLAVASEALYGQGAGVRLTQNLFGVKAPPEPAEAPVTEEDSALMQMLERLITEPEPPKEDKRWQGTLLRDLLTPDVQSTALVTPTQFEGTTIPRRWTAPFDPRQLATLARSRWPWLAGILGWLAVREPKQESAFDPEDEEYDEEESTP